MVRTGTRRRGTVAILAGALALGALAGCSSSDDDASMHSAIAAPSSQSDAGSDQDSASSLAIDEGPQAQIKLPESAAGKDCVAFDDVLPAGAPEVPITPGSPPTELVTEDLVVGTGPAVPARATVTVDNIGVSCSTGTIFDDSYSRGQQATFGLDQVIPGWTEGLVGMQAGGQRLLVIPPDMGYGSMGSPPVIAPDETLYFVVTLDSFQ